MLERTQQFAYIYLHPANQAALHLTNRGVSAALTVGRNVPLDNTHHIWPRQPDNTNFRMAKVDYTSTDRDTNTGHSEYQLLHGNGLDTMIQRMAPCPEFMIIYTTNLPCMRARNRDGTLVPGKRDRCLEMIGAAKTQLLNACPNAFVYLYTHQAAARTNCVKDQNFFQWEQDYLRDNDIIWLHP